MKPKDVKDYYGSSYNFNKVTGMAHATLNNWLKWGFVPEDAQYKLERLTDGELKTEWGKNDEKENVNFRAEKLSLLIGRMIGKIAELSHVVQQMSNFPDSIVLETLKNIHDMAADELNDLYCNDIKK